MRILVAILALSAAAVRADWVLYNTATGQQLSLDGVTIGVTPEPGDPNWATYAQDADGNCIGNGKDETTQTTAQVGYDPETGEVNDTNPCTRVGGGGVGVIPLFNLFQQGVGISGIVK